MYIALAQLGNPELVGQFAIALAISGPVIFVSNLQLRAIQASDADWSHSFAEYWSLRLFMLPFALAMIVAIACIGNYNVETISVILVLGFAKLIESLSDICFGAIQRNNRLDLVGKSLSIKGVTSLLLMCLLVWATQSVAIASIGIAITWLALFIFFDSANVKKKHQQEGLERISFKPQWNWSQQKKLISLGLPMGNFHGITSTYRKST